MDPKTKLEIEKTVLEILENANMNDMTEYKVRKLAGEKLGHDLSDAKYKKLVRNIVESFLQSRDDEEEQPATEELASQKQEEVQEEVEEEVEEKASKKQQKKKKNVESEEEEEEEEEEERPAKKQRKQISKQRGPVQEAGTDENGDVFICKLSNRRSVTIQNFRGKKLVSIREYYEKGGKQMPSSKGISLSMEQWEALKKGVPAIEAAIEQLKN